MRNSSISHLKTAANNLSKNILFISIILFFCQTNIFSQSKFSIGINGGITRNEKGGYGTMIVISRNIKENFYFTFSTGYILWNEETNYASPQYSFKEEQVEFDEISTVPIVIGGKYFFGSQKFKPFITGEMGYNFIEYYVYRNKDNVIGLPGVTTIERNKDDDLALSFGLGIGVSYLISDDMILDFSAIAHSSDNVDQYVRFMAGINFLM